METKKNFICTTDKEVAQELREKGFVAINVGSDGIFAFINDVGKAQFAEDSKIAKKIFYSNRLNI